MFELKLLAACALWFAGNLVIDQHGATSWFWLDASAVSSAPWRLWSGHLVHQDMYHAALDIGFFAAEALLARRAFIVPVIVVAPIVSLIVMALRPELGYYVGASALGYFAASYSAIVLGGWRGLACFAPCLRPIYHLLTAAPVAAAPWTGGLVPVMEAHVAGIGLGVTFALVAVTTRTRRAGQAVLLLRSEPSIRSGPIFAYIARVTGDGLVGLHRLYALRGAVRLSLLKASVKTWMV